MRPELRKRGRGRGYVDLDRKIPGKRDSYEKIPGVTTIVRDGKPSAALIGWAGVATTEYAINNWDELNAMPPGDRYKAISKGRYEGRDKAGDRGTEIHALARDLVGGAAVPVPPELKGYVGAAVRFMDEFDVRPFATELIVFNETHYYCGQLDLGASILIPDLAMYEWIPRDDEGRARALIDYKSGASGIWGDIAWQLAPYRYAEWAIEDGEIIEVPEFDFAMGVHLRPDGTYSAIPVLCEWEQFQQFLTVKENAENAEHANELLLTELAPPLMHTHHLVKVTDDSEETA
jgi:hypothetical protein